METGRMEALVKSLAHAAQARYVIDDESKVGEARRAAQTLANYEFDADLAGRVAIVATELANNLLRHAGGGELLIQTLGAEDATTFELLAIDRGPGMSNVDRCMSDGYSTHGTAGTGLGAVRRLANDFDIYSMPGEGTVVMARFGAAAGPNYGAISVALAGEVDCGDAWRVSQQHGITSIMVVDGLGHGGFATEAARAGIGAFSTAPLDPPMEILMRANRTMSKTRGGAAACARLEAGALSYAGVGNISGSLHTPAKSQGLISHNGTLGMYQRHSQPFEYAAPPGTLLVMHSDGLSARWDLNSRAALLTRHPAIVAGVLYRDHGRARDDATVVVLAT